MGIKEHPFVVTTTFQGDGDTIKYDITQPGRSAAVGKAFRINAEGKGVLVDEGEEMDGKVLEVDDDHKFTGAYMFGGLTFPIGQSLANVRHTVQRGDRLVGALGPNRAKGYVQAVRDVSTPPTTLADVASTDVDTDGEVAAVINADRAAINSLSDIAGDLTAVGKGRARALEVSATQVLATFPG